MNVCEIERHLFSHYLAHGANELSIAGRFYTYTDLVSSIADKIRLRSGKFGKTVSSKAMPVAGTFLRIMIERGGFSTVEQKIGNDMHQFREKTYRQVLRELQDQDGILRQARQEGPAFWERVFAELSGNC